MTMNWFKLLKKRALPIVLSICVFAAAVPIGVLLQAGAEDTLVNLALGADVTCDAAHANFNPDNLTDGDYSFEDHSLVVQTADAFVIDVDLGKVKTFNRLTLIPSADNPGWFIPDVEISVSSDNQVFDVVASFAELPAPTDQTPVNFDINDGVTARYVRLTVSHSWAREEWWGGYSYDSRVAELELYNVESLTPPEEEEEGNLALGADVTCDAAHQNFPASNLTDGDYSFEGHSLVVQTADAFVIDVDLGKVKTFNRLTLIPSADNPGWFLANFTISVAGADQEFSQIMAVGVPDSVPTDQTPVNYDFEESVTAQYVRLSVPNGAWTDNGWSFDSRIAELEIYNVKDQTPPVIEDSDNLALGADVTCDAAHPNFNPDNLTDGNYEFEGHSLVVQTENEFVIDVDLGKVKTFNRLTIVPSKDNPGWYLPDIKLYAAGEDKTFTLVRDFGVQTAPTDQTPVNYDIYKGVTAQYVRLVVSSGWWTGQSLDSRIAELELYYIEGLTGDSDNLALGADVTCDAARDDFPASNLTDGNYDFQDHSMVVQSGEAFSIIVDLGKVKTFNRLTIVPSKDNPGWYLPDIKLYAAGEDKNFTLVKNFGSQSSPIAQTPINYNIYEGVTARYVRLDVSGGWTENGWYFDSRIAELEIYHIAELIPPIIEDSDNLALGADASCNAAHRNFPASNLTDGNYEFEGHSLVVQSPGAFSITVDLYKEKTFNTLTLVPSADNPGWYLPNFVVYAAGEDGEFYQVEAIRVREIPTDQTPISYYLHQDVTARYLRLDVPGAWWNGMSNDSRLAELELYYVDPLDKVPLRVIDASASYEYGLDGGIPTGTKYLTDGKTDQLSGMYFNTTEAASLGKLLGDAVTITFLMEKPAIVHEVLLYHGRNWPSTFMVSLSADGGKTWGKPTLVADMTWGNASSYYTVSVEPQKANAVKFLFADVVPAETAWGNFGYLSLAEVEVYGRFIDEVLPTPTLKDDIVYSYEKIDMSYYLDGYNPDAWPGDPTSYNSWDIRSELLEITNSFEHADYTPRFSKAYLIDGKYELRGDGWSSYRVRPDGTAIGEATNEVNQTIRLKLPAEYLVGQIALCAKIGNANNFPKDFTISVSTDGNNWTVVREVKDYRLTNGELQQLFTFEPARAAYIKLDIATVGGNIDDVNVGWGVSLTELEVYRVTGMSSSGSSVPTGDTSRWPIAVGIAATSGVIMLGCIFYDKKRRNLVAR